MNVRNGLIVIEVMMMTLCIIKDNIVNAVIENIEHFDLEKPIAQAEVINAIKQEIKNILFLERYSSEHQTMDNERRA